MVVGIGMWSTSAPSGDRLHSEIKGQRLDSQEMAQAA